MIKIDVRTQWRLKESALQTPDKLLRHSARSNGRKVLEKDGLRIEGTRLNPTPSVPKKTVIL